MDTVLYAICAAAGWSAFSYVLRQVLRAPDTARMALCSGYGCFAAGVTVAIPPVAGAIDNVAHVPNLAKVLAHAGAMGICASAEWMLLYLALPASQARPKALRRLWATIGAFTVMIALAGYVAMYHPHVRLIVDYARVSAVTAYLAIYLAAFSAYMVDNASLCWRYARVSHHRPWLRRGLRTTAVGSAVALVYCANKAVYLVGFWLGINPPGERYVAAVLVTIAGLANLAGLSLPSWGPLLLSPRQWRANHQAYRLLTPLWRDIIAEVPRLELDKTLRRAVSVWRDPDYALTRRVAEIRDGRLALRAYIDQRITDLAVEYADRAGLTGTERQAVIEAAQLAAGIRWHAAGVPARRPGSTEVHDPAGGYAGEIAWLVRMAQAYATSPVVADVVAAADRIHAGEDVPPSAVGGNR